MNLGLALIKDELELEPVYEEYRGREGCLDLEKFQLYDKEDKLEKHTLYLSYTSEVRKDIKCDDSSAMILLENTSGKCCPPKCACLVLESRYSFISLANGINGLFQKAQFIENQLQEAVYMGQSFQTLADIFRDVPHNEIIIMNSDFYLVAHSTEDIRLYQISGLEQDYQTHRLPAENLEFFKNDITYSKVRDLKEPFIYGASIYAVDVLCMNVFLYNEFVCRVVFCEIDTPFRAYDRELIRYFTGWIQKKYDLLKAEDSYQKDSRLNSLLLDLIRQKNVEPWLLEKQLSGQGWHADSDFVCALIQPSSRDYYNHTLSYYCQIILKNFSMVIPLEYESRIVCVVNLSDYHLTVNSFIAEFICFLRDSFFKAGFSSQFTDLESLYAYYRQAEIALNTGTDTESSSWLYRFEDQFLNYIRHMLTSDIPAKFLIHPKLRILQDYDARHGTSYVKTFIAYIDCKMNAAETAQKLYIHRATMMYRLKRIRELTDMDFDISSEMLYLIISCKLLM